MGANSDLRRGKKFSLNAAARRTESAIIILFGNNIAAVAEKARLLESLRKSNIGANPFTPALFVVVSNNFFRRNFQVGVRIIAQEIFNALLLGRHRRANNRSVRGRSRRRHGEIFSHVEGVEIIFVIGFKLAHSLGNSFAQGRQSFFLNRFSFNFRVVNSGFDSHWKIKCKRAEHSRRNESPYVKKFHIITS